MIRGSKALVAALLAVLSVVMMTTAVEAQQYPVQPTVTVDRPAVVQGENVTISGTGWSPECNVVLSYNPVIGEATVNPDGTFTFVWNTAGVPVGPQTVTITQPCTGQSLQVQVTVMAPGSSTTPSQPTQTGTLPRTGTDSTGMLLRGGLVLLALGGLALLAGRRMRSDATA